MMMELGIRYVRGIGLHYSKGFFLALYSAFVVQTSCILQNHLVPQLMDIGSLLNL